MASGIEMSGVARSMGDPLHEHILHAPDRLFDLLPVAAYVCAADGRIARFNRRAAELWGRSPEIGESGERYCGSHRLYRADGAVLAHAKCPMADVLRSGIAVRDREMLIERPDGSRVVALANIEPVRDGAGKVIGAVNCFHETAGRERTDARLRENERRLRALVDAAPVAFYTTDAAGRITFYNEAAAELWGRRPELGTGEWCGSWRLRWPDGKPMRHDECPMAVALKEGRPVRGAEAVAERPDGTRVHFLAFPTPLWDESGALAGAANTLVEITERKLVEQVTERLARIVESSDDAILSLDMDGLVTSWNKGAERLYGLAADEAVGRSVTVLIPPERRNEEGSILDRIRRGERIEHYETVRRRNDGSLLDVSLTVSPIADSTGRIVGASKIARDITERKRAQRHQELLLAELNHRVKNMLAVVAAIAAQTAGAAASVEEFQDAFSGRLHALARTYTLLTARQWQAAPLAEIVEDTFQPHLDSGSERIGISGPDLAVRPKAALTLGMILHELVTNASKYGALSVEGGRISVDWQVLTSRHGPEEVLLRWREDGMTALRPSHRQGFGTWLIETSARHELGGAVEMSYHPHGLECDLRFRRERLCGQDE